MKAKVFCQAVISILFSPRWILAYLNVIAYTMIGVGFWKLQPGLFVPGLLLWLELFMEVRNARSIQQRTE